MADATVIIEGGIVAEPRLASPNGNRVGNLTVRAGRSRKNEQGGYDELSSTAYDVACWNEVHDLLMAQSPEVGSQVRITGTISGSRTYEDRQGVTQPSIEVRAEGVKVWPKRGQQQGGGGFSSGQGGYAPAPQNGPQGGGQGGYGAPQGRAQQGGDPWAGNGGGGYDDPPF